MRWGDAAAPILRQFKLAIRPRWREEAVWRPVECLIGARKAPAAPIGRDCDCRGPTAAAPGSRPTQWSMHGWSRGLREPSIGIPTVLGCPSRPHSLPSWSSQPHDVRMCKSRRPPQITPPLPLLLVPAGISPSCSVFVVSKVVNASGGRTGCFLFRGSLVTPPPRASTPLPGGSAAGLSAQRDALSAGFCDAVEEEQVDFAEYEGQELTLYMRCAACGILSPLRPAPRCTALLAPIGAQLCWLPSACSMPRLVSQAA